MGNILLQDLPWRSLLWMANTRHQCCKICWSTFAFGTTNEEKRREQSIMELFFQWRCNETVIKIHRTTKCKFKYDIIELYFIASWSNLSKYINDNHYQRVWVFYFLKSLLWNKSVYTNQNQYIWNASHIANLSNFIITKQIIIKISKISYTFHCSKINIWEKMKL